MVDTGPSSRRIVTLTVSPAIDVDCRSTQLDSPPVVVPVDHDDPFAGLARVVECAVRA